MSNNITDNKSVDIAEIKKMVGDFQTIRLLNDQTNMVGLQVQGHAILYKQLAEAYRIGLILLTRGNGTKFCRIMEENGMQKESEKYGNNKYTNPWNFVTKLLYGKWVEKKVSCTVFEVYERDRSAEKYANIFRYLQNKEIEADKAADFITEFTHEYGNGLHGIEKVDREENSSSKFEKPERNNDIAVGKNVDEDDVFTFDAPESLKDVQFGTCFFEIKDSQIIMFGADELEEKEFNAMCAKRGRKITAKWNKQQKEADKLAKDAERTFKKAVNLIKSDTEFEQLKKQLLGDPEWAQYLLDEKDTSKRNASRLTDYVSKMKNLAELFDHDNDSPVSRKLTNIVKGSTAAEANS